MLGDLLRDARRRADMTQEQLASRTRLTREYVSLLELGKRTPTIFVFIRLARALGMTPSELIAAVERRCPQDVALADHIPYRSPVNSRRRRIKRA